jgi:hypothetical protein
VNARYLSASIPIFSICRRFRQFRLFVWASIGGALPRSTELPKPRSAIRRRSFSLDDKCGRPVGNLIPLPERNLENRSHLDIKLSIRITRAILSFTNYLHAAGKNFALMSVMLGPARLFGSSLLPGVA